MFKFLNKRKCKKNGHQFSPWVESYDPVYLREKMRAERDDETFMEKYTQKCLVCGVGRDLAQDSMVTKMFGLEWRPY